MLNESKNCLLFFIRFSFFYRLTTIQRVSEFYQFDKCVEMRESDKSQNYRRAK